MSKLQEGERWPRVFTCKPDSAASEASSGPHHLASLDPAHIWGLVHHIGGSVQILISKEHIVRTKHCFYKK